MAYSNPYYSSSYDEYAQRQKQQKQQQQPTQSGAANTGYGTAWGAAGGALNIAGSALENNKPRQSTNYTESRKNSEKAATAGITAAASSFPIIGGFMKLGQGIGEQTTDEWGMYKGKTTVGKTAYSFIDNNINPTTGIQNFSDLSKDITVGTLANQFTAGLIGKSASQKKAEKGKKDFFAAKKVSQERYNKTHLNRSLTNNHMEEYNKRMDKTNRMNNLYSIPKTYQQMF